jgi:hypothetical protein
MLKMLPSGIMVSSCIGSYPVTESSVRSRLMLKGRHHERVLQTSMPKVRNNNDVGEDYTWAARL